MGHRTMYLLMTGLTGMALLVASLTPAHACYIDPGSGSYLFQLAIGGIVGAFYALRSWFFIRRRDTKGHNSVAK